MTGTFQKSIMNAQVICIQMTVTKERNDLLESPEGVNAGKKKTKNKKVKRKLLTYSG